MRLPVFLSIVAAIAAVNVEAKPKGPTATINRFTFKGNNIADEALTPAQRYARELTRRAPTRRATAEKRQESEVAASTQSISLGVTNDDTGSFVGYADVGLTGLEIKESPGLPFSHLANPTWTINTNQRITISNPLYPNLGLVQRPGESATLGPGLSSSVYIAGVTSYTLPGSLPDLLVNSITGLADLAVETDIWTVNYNTGAMIPIWVNPDGTAVTLTVVTDGTSIVATGDVAAFNDANGGGWFAISLAFSIAPP
ncbi:hypothetical protein CVT24_006400 [Panaeolus cyanescens]|uniref:Peptidase A1 domain-containing protein n=1 Tax=Panaeolus cyanescens TaxID=181874 RepID=A0A409WBW1_9AGAR|nr:hypothetical protein CVT24_006400 [Panaeolus cyanescens]